MKAMRANVFIASRRSEEGSRLLWRNVPVETAKRLCSLEETCWALEACRARERLSSQERLRLKEAVIRAREILERI